MIALHGLHGPRREFALVPVVDGRNPALQQFHHCKKESLHIYLDFPKVADCRNHERVVVGEVAVEGCERRTSCSF